MRRIAPLMFVAAMAAAAGCKSTGDGVQRMTLKEIFGADSESGDRRRFQEKMDARAFDSPTRDRPWREDAGQY